MTRPADVQATFDAIPDQDDLPKELFMMARDTQ
jgi:hypothetical protein